MLEISLRLVTRKMMPDEFIGARSLYALSEGGWRWGTEQMEGAIYEC
jgi:hypothetical protein